MGRPRLFDEDKAVEAACRVFWAKGYEGTSTEDLCAATGLGRSSVYNTFKSKAHLFRRALSCYVDTMTARQVAVLDEGGRNAIERIQRLLDVIIDGEMENRREGYGSGCFTVNTITGLASKDPLVAEILEKDLERRLFSLRSVVNDGKRDGSISSPSDAQSLAWYLVAVIYGMRVAAQSGADAPALARIASTSAVALTS
ncbi:TetR/AcrR family transcriptional regulator [Streptomyces sp. DT24]|uniref:TetR/AcrR family transcriptional regulator n=1 Tax=Streptomyces sp. DT24 TaxID=3416520 RepID=UPI003CECCC8C